MSATRVLGVSGPKKVGGYDVDVMLGKGGMGEVWKAHHPRLGRPIALKRLLLSKDGDDDDNAALLERFVREGQAMAKLRHESIPAIYDLFDHRGDTWIALEYVDGFTVQELLKAGPLAPDVACLIALGVVRALAVAHRAGILHRDIKPANVMVSSDGIVKLMDFGIAKDEAQNTMTETGSVVGTPAYLAPEVIKGLGSSPQSDVYAAGCLLYEMLAGRRAFAHADPASIWGLIATGRYPRLGKVAPQLPWRLTLLVERTMKTDPKRRPSSAAELAALIARFLDDHGAPADSALRLTGYLVAVGKVPEETLQAMLPDTTALYIVHEEIPLKRRLVPWRVAALCSMLVTSVLLGILAFFPSLLQGILR
ncbi:MAG: serine/threonine-protein kinase [Deltaproteobacteria bacterium]|nr:serine/threonine-protein kinase [Deltaproteobacteria bacterium]